MPLYQKVCQECGAKFEAARADARYHSNTCNQRARRKSMARLKHAPNAQVILEGAALLQQLKRILPRTAESIEAFIAENEAAQTGILVRLALTAHMESAQAVNHEE